MREARGRPRAPGRLQAIADANGGTREAGTQGYEDSVDYVVERMTAAGYNVTLNPFPFIYIAGATLSQLTPVAAEYETGAFTASGSGTVTGNVIPVDINLAPPRAARAAARPPTSLARTRRSDRHRAHPARHLHVRAEGRRRRRPPAPRR